MNRRERRAAAARERQFSMTFEDFDKRIDISVEGKDTATGPVVMIFGNTRGRRLVEEFWSEVEWTRDATFASMHPDPQWAFAHVRVVQLPQHLAATGIEPEEATSESLAFAVATALQAHAEPRSVVHWVGHAPNVEARFYESVDREHNAAREMEVEYLAPGWLCAGTA
jgi:hypothetical protein